MRRVRKFDFREEHNPIKFKGNSQSATIQKAVFFFFLLKNIRHNYDINDDIN